MPEIVGTDLSFSANMNNKEADFLIMRLMILQRLVEPPEVRHKRLFLVSVGGLIVTIH